MDSNKQKEMRIRKDALYKAFDHFKEDAVTSKDLLNYMRRSIVGLKYPRVAELLYEEFKNGNVTRVKYEGCFLYQLTKRRN